MRAGIIVLCFISKLYVLLMLYFRLLLFIMLCFMVLKESYYTLFLQVIVVPWCPNEMSVTYFSQNTLRMKHNISSIALPKQPCSALFRTVGFECLSLSLQMRHRWSSHFFWEKNQKELANKLFNVDCKKMFLNDESWNLFYFFLKNVYVCMLGKYSRPLTAVCVTHCL